MDADGTRMVRRWYADGTRMVRGWYADGTRWYADGTRMDADGTRMVRGWYAGDFGQFSCPTLEALEARGGSVEASGPQN